MYFCLCLYCLMLVIALSCISVERYLNEVHSQALQAATGVNAIPTGAHIRDDEQVSSVVCPQTPLLKLTSS